MTRHPLALFRAAILCVAIIPALLTTPRAEAAPFAAYVMDARTGKPLYAQNADARLHPASLTKMMTLYLAFAAIERGQVRLDSKFTISSHAAAEPPSRLGLRPGQKIELRYLIRAAAIKSANDAATAIGEGLAGSEAAFGQQMTATARALGMRNSQFRNANGLTQEGHFSSAEDMTILGRRLFYDFPQYYSLFSRRTADAGVAQVASTNKRFLDEYPGADGIKTGYTRAAGFNLTASAQRGNKRIVATVLGGTSTAQRNAIMGQLLDAGFGRAPVRAREVRPAAPELLAQKVVRRAQVAPDPNVVASPAPAALTLTRSEPPRRATAAASVMATAAPAAPASEAGAVAAPTQMALSRSARPMARPERAPVQTASAPAPAPEATDVAQTSASLAGAAIGAPRPRPAKLAAASDAAGEVEEGSAPEAAPAAGVIVTEGPLTLARSVAPRPRSEQVILAAMGEGDTAEPEAVEKVSRKAATARGWSVSLGRFGSEAEANRLLLQTTLQDGAALDGARRHIAPTAKGFEPRLAGLTRAAAERVCERLNASQGGCRVLAP